MKASPPEVSSPAVPKPPKARPKTESVEVLLKQRSKLASELKRLQKWRETVNDSFKIAWQEERAAHQRDLELSTRTQSAAESRARALEHELSAERALREQHSASDGQEIARLKAEVQTIRHNMREMRRHGSLQLESLRRHVTRVRAEKGELCEEFAQKLRLLSTSAAPASPHVRLDSSQGHGTERNSHRSDTSACNDVMSNGGRTLVSPGAASSSGESHTNQGNPQLLQRVQGYSAEYKGLSIFAPGGTAQQAECGTSPRPNWSH